MENPAFYFRKKFRIPPFKYGLNSFKQKVLLLQAFSKKYTGPYNPASSRMG
jgi:hypothetical protein